MLLFSLTKPISQNMPLPRVNLMRPRLGAAPEIEAASDVQRLVCQNPGSRSRTEDAIARLWHGAFIHVVRSEEDGRLDRCPAHLAFNSIFFGLHAYTCLESAHDAIDRRLQGLLRTPVVLTAPPPHVQQASVAQGDESRLGPVAV